VPQLSSFAGEINLGEGGHSERRFPQVEGMNLLSS
jgi:hypothetical protein